MPPGQPPYSLLLKSSTSTFFIILPPTATFSTLQSTLLTQLQDNKPHLPASLTQQSSSSLVPQSLVLGVPKDSSDPRKGFVALDSGTYKKGKGTISSAGIKDGSVLAFMVVNDEDEDSWNGEFDVQWPVDEYYDSQKG